MTAGKCLDCSIVYHWSGKPLLRDAICPVCGHSLRATSHQLQRYEHRVGKPDDRRRVSVVGLP